MLECIAGQVARSQGKIWRSMMEPAELADSWTLVLERISADNVKILLEALRQSLLLLFPPYGW